MSSHVLHALLQYCFMPMILFALWSCLDNELVHTFLVLPRGKGGGGGGVGWACALLPDGPID